jgi:acylphosphatase
MTQQAVRLRISGRVQGVGYRAWAVRRAAELGLRGWVRNRADGSVEALAIGNDDAVAAMIEACRKGPLGARVVNVNTSNVADDGSLGFDARRTI